MVSSKHRGSLQSQVSTGGHITYDIYILFSALVFFFCKMWEVSNEVWLTFSIGLFTYI